MEHQRDDHAFSLRFFRGYSVITTGKRWVEIECDTLDDITSELGLNRVDFIKIDAERAELEILKGAERILGSPNVKLSITAYHSLPNGSPEFPQLLSFLESRGIHLRNEKKIGTNISKSSLQILNRLLRSSVALFLLYTIYKAEYDWATASRWYFQFTHEQSSLKTNPVQQPP